MRIYRSRQLLGLATLFSTARRMTLNLLLHTVLLLLLLLAQRCCGMGSLEDIQCLKDFKNSVTDPFEYLESWTFADPMLDICTLLGVNCLHGVIDGLNLANSSLVGSFPKVDLCRNLNNLDLSNNDFTGPISRTLCNDDSQLVTINLANNHFNDSVPDTFASCFYLNNLYLQMNDLCGPVPNNINNKTLPRLKIFETYGNRKLGKQCSGLPQPSSPSNPNLIVGIAIGVLGVGVLVVLGFLLYLCCFARHLGGRSAGWHDKDWVRRIRAPNLVAVYMFEKPLVKLKLSDLIAATNNFSQANVVSVRKSGTLYKGTLKDGTVMSIKRLKVTDHTHKKFRAEMETLGKLQHRNLVPLLGYCIAGKERFLVYNPMPGGSLVDLLRGTNSLPNSVKEKSEGRLLQPPLGDAEADVENGSHPPGTAEMEATILDWRTRLKLAIGTARGLAWLHHSCNPRVLHRDISPSNILLDDELEPRISNFGMARLMNPVHTHISTFVNGDIGDVGYVAPEYPRTLVATVKGDVFSFGVVMLELITGQKASEVKAGKFKGILAAWVWMLYNSGKVGDSIDKSLVDGVRDDELMQFLKLGVSCAHPVARERPSMYEVFHMLRSIGEKYDLTDENDEIPLAASTADLEAPGLTVTQKELVA